MSGKSEVDARSSLGVKLPVSFTQVLYIPVYSTDDGIRWTALPIICFDAREAKDRLKRWMPSSVQASSDSRFTGLRIGCVILDITRCEQSSVEFVPSDFLAQT